MGRKKQEANSVLPLRPPACLAVLDNVKDGEEKKSLLEDLIAEAPEVQSRLKDQLKQFRTEVYIFQRLMYKNKNQHRHGLYYRRLLQVRRDLGLLDYSALDKNVEGFTRWTFSFKESRVNVDQRNLGKDQVRSTLSIFLSATRILNQIDKPILAASTQILGLLSQTFFMALGLTIVSSLARLRVLSQQLLFEFATVYNLLSVLSIEVPESRKPKTQFRAIPVEGSHSPLPSHLECHWDEGKLCITEIEPPPEVLRTRAEVAEPGLLAIPSTGLWFVDDRKSLAVSNRTATTGPPISGAKVLTAGDLRFAADGPAVKYDVRVSAVIAREEPGRVPENAKSHSTFLQHESKGAASVRQNSLDEPSAEVSVIGVSSDGVKDSGMDMKDEEESTVLGNTADFVTNLSESSRSLTSAEEILPGQVAEVFARTKVLATVDQLDTIGATAWDSYTSVVSSVNPEHRPMDLDRREGGGSGSRLSAEAWHEEEHQASATDEGDGLTLEKFVHDASTAGKVCSAKVSSHACEDTTGRETSQGQQSCSDQVLLSKAQRDGTVLNGTVIESSVECRERKDVGNQGLTRQVTKRAVAYISVRPPPESYVERHKDDNEKAQAIELGVGALDKLGHMRVENGFLESFISAHGQSDDKNTSRQAPKGIPGHTIVSPGARSQKEGGLCAPTSVPDITLALDRDKQSILLGPVTRTSISVCPESSSQKKMECSLEVISETTTPLDLSVAQVSAAAEKDEDASLPRVSVDATSKNIWDAEVVEEPKRMPVERILTIEASEDREYKLDTDITLVERRKEMEAVSVSKRGAKRRADKTSGSERPRKRLEASKHDVAVSEKKLGNAKGRVDKTLKKKPLKGNGGKKKQLESKPDGLKRQVNKKTSKKKDVNDLFNMLLGGL